MIHIFKCIIFFFFLYPKKKSESGWSGKSYSCNSYRFRIGLDHKQASMENRKSLDHSRKIGPVYQGGARIHHLSPHDNYHAHLLLLLLLYFQQQNKNANSCNSNHSSMDTRVYRLNLEYMHCPVEFEEKRRA